MLDVLSDNGDTKEKALISKNIISGKGSTFNRDENAEDLPSKVKDEPVDINKTYKIGSILAEAFYNFNKGKERDRYKEGTKIAPKPQSRALERVNLPQKKITRSGSDSSGGLKPPESGGLFDGIESAIDNIQGIVDNVKSAKKLLSFTRKRGVKGLGRLASRKIGRSKVGKLAGSIKGLRGSPLSKTVREIAPKAVTKTAEKVASKAVTKTVGKPAEKVASEAVTKTVGKPAEKVASKAVTKTAEKVASEAVTKTVGKPAEKVASKAVTKTVGKPAAKVVAKTAGKTLGKSLIKKIPLVGAAAGAIFAAQRAMKGDFLGAGLELVSGISSTLPAVGTAVSIAADAALAAKDINAASKEATAAPVASKAAGKVVSTSTSKAIDKTTEKAAPKAAVAAPKATGRAAGALRVGSGVLGKVFPPLALAVAGVAAATKLLTELGRANLQQQAEQLDGGKVPANTPPSIQPNVTPMVPPKQEVVGKVDMPSVKPSTPIVDVNLNDQNSLIKQQTNVMLAILDVSKKQLVAKGGEASSAPPIINVSPQQPTRENVTFTNGRDIYLSSPYSLT